MPDVQAARPDVGGHRLPSSASAHNPQAELETLRQRLQEATDTIEAIRDGTVDAFVVARGDREEIYTLGSADRPYRLMVETMRQGAVTLSADGVILYCNPRFVELSGVSKPEVTGRALRDMVAKHDRDFYDTLVEQGVNGPVEGELSLQRQDGSWMPACLTLSPLPLDDGRALCVLVTDLTERKHYNELCSTQAALQASEERYRQADRRKDEFLAILAHELRNPLAPTMNALEVMRSKQRGDDEMQWAQDVIGRQVAQMAHLIDDLLDIGRITSDKLELRRERIDLATAVREALMISRALIEQSGHTLIVTLPPDPVYLDADLVRLAQVFSNLLNNAAKYTNPGGSLWLTAERHGDSLEVTFRDTGIGIPPEMLPRVFDMFMQVDRTLTRSHGGLGIGLTLVKRLVEIHGGTIEARSAGPSQGSTFIVRLPVAAGQSASAAIRSSTPTTLPHSTWRILIVDDNRASADSLSVVLGLAGNTTRIAYDGAEAVGAAESFRPDVVLLDVGLPKLDGYEVCRQLRARPWGRDVTIVALTGWGQEEDRRRSSEAGFDEHLVKPANPLRVLQLLKELRSSPKTAPTVQ